MSAKYPIFGARRRFSELTYVGTIFAFGYALEIGVDVLEMDAVRSAPSLPSLRCYALMASQDLHTR